MAELQLQVSAGFLLMPLLMVSSIQRLAILQIFIPLIQLDKWLNGADIHAVGYALDDTTSEVDKIGTQETY